MSAANAIEVHELSKRFGNVVAVDRVTFNVEPGEIFGFMGHNGAGKTTTLRMLLGLTRKTAGRASVLGLDIERDTLDIRRASGFLPASYALPPDMTARQFLLYVAAMFSLPGDVARERTGALIQRFGLEGAADRPLKGFSTGMTQKVGLAQALINEPRVLFLDEPTSGLDPLGRHELLMFLRELAQTKGVTIVFSSHILSDVETLCERVAVLHHGKLIAQSRVAELKAAHGVSTMDELYLALVRKEAA
jgi:ABC-2 type transport system ATP-binding protein